MPLAHHARLRSDTLVSSVLLLMIVTVVQRTVGLGRSVLFCRWLSPESLGEWEMAYSFLLLAAPLAVLGVPGSFGRYLEHYRQRGHLHTFLRRTTLWTVVCGVSAVAIVVALAEPLAGRVFRDASYGPLVRGIALCLAAVIFHHTLTSLLTALRLFRVASAMHFAQSMLFTGLALGLLCFDANVASVLIGYGIACLVATLGAVVWVWPAIRDIERPVEPLPKRDFWPRLLRFAAFVWLTNLLSHLFAVTDRYMILHYSGLDATGARELVGHYHSSRIIPLLAISFADLLSGLILPHLSHDWEAERRKEVGNQVRLAVKLTAIGMFGFGIGVLLFAPWLFDVVLQGKYSNGLVVLPWTLVACVGYGTYLIAQNYLWCAEKTRLTAIPLGLGLAGNIALNLVLLPIWGLTGAVVATATATLCCLTTILLLSRKHGMPLDKGTWIAIFAPISLTAGPAVAGLAWLVLATAAVATSSIFSSDERKRLRELGDQLVAKVPTVLARRFSTTSNT